MTECQNCKENVFRVWHVYKKDQSLPPESGESYRHVATHSTKKYAEDYINSHEGEFRIE